MLLQTCLLLFFFVSATQAEPTFYEHPDFLIANWMANEGVPENSAFTVAQTPDGYLWVGSVGGLLRFNGQEFERVAGTVDLRRLGQVIHCVKADRTGRLWVATDSGHAVLEDGVWRRLEGTNVSVRSIAEDDLGQVYFGTAAGQLFVVQNDRLQPADAPPSLVASGVFCGSDERDGCLWVANRGFIGKRTGSGWQRFGPSSAETDALIATPARGGGLWVYCRGELRRYRADAPVQMFPAPSVQEPRDLLEDRFGKLWIASNLNGLVCLTPGREDAVSITAGRGLAHDTTRCVFEDTEGNLWVGTSNGGLHRLRRRQFLSLGVEQGLPDRIVRSITEESPGRMLAGTHGGGVARIENGKVTWVQPMDAKRTGIYAWSVLRDRSGRVWTGTFRDGLFVEEGGVRRSVTWPRRFEQISAGHTVYGLLEDSQGLIWVGTVAGVGCIRGDKIVPWASDTNFMPYAVHCLAEDRKAGAVWIGTYSRGLFRLRGSQSEQYRVSGNNLPNSDRISSIHVDDDGCVWAGVFGQGLVCVRDGIVTHITSDQGLPAETIGSILDDGLGFFWLGSNRGILRVSRQELHAVVSKQSPKARFLEFDRNDGLASTDCSEGYQPTAVRDQAGRLWFATLKGVVIVSPAQLSLNTNPPPVAFEQFSFIDREGTLRDFRSPWQSDLSVPAGSSEIKVQFAALSLAAPEKVRYAYRLVGRQENWVEVGDRRTLDFRSLRPGAYRLQLKAANNDGVWNETGATLAFTVRPFLWQTLWFRLLATAGLATGVGFTGWRLARNQLQRQIERLKQERALEQERTRLAAVMQATSDLVVFTDPDGRLLHLNPAGARLLGLSPTADLRGMEFGDLYPVGTRERMLNEAVPAAIRDGTWQGDTRLLRRDGVEIPVSQVLVAHRNEDGSLAYLGGIVRDILDRKRAEDALRESEQKLRTILQAAPVGIGLVVNGVLVEANARVTEMTGFTRAELIGTSTRGLYPTQADFDRVVEVKSKQLAVDGSGMLETRWKRKDGAILEVLLTSMPLDPADLSRGVVFVALDITARKRAEVALREKTEELDRYFTSSLDLLCIADTDGHFRRLNPEWTRTLGYTVEELLGRRFLDFVHADDLAGTLEAVARLSQQQEIVGFVNRYRCKGGGYRWLEWRAYPQGQLIFAVARDITEHKQTEALLQNLATSFLTVSAEEFANKVSSYLATTLQMDYAYVGECVGGSNRVRVIGGYAPDGPLQLFEYELAGTPCDQVVGRSFHAYPSAVQQLFPQDPMLGKLGIEGYVGMPLFDRSGNRLGVLVALSSTPLVDTRMASTLFSLFAGRVEAELERRRTEEEKGRLQAQLLQAHKMESVGRLAGGVAHDFNNMLQVILGNTALALSQTQPGDPVHEDLLEIQKSAFRSADLTRQLLAFARKQTISPRILDLNETVSGMLKMLRRLIGEDIDLVWSPGNGLWPVKMDPAQVDQILANLAANARDAITGPGSLSLGTANVTLANADVLSQPDVAAGDYVSLSVSDTGRGMSPEVLEHLFEPFYTTKEVGKGTGLGLATVFGIVKQNGGFIQVRSEPGIGTTFKIHLRRADAADAGEATKAAIAPRPGTETILLVEDEAQVLNLGARILRQQGYTVLTASAPEKAIALATQHQARIHLLVTDVVMPGMNGRELKNRLDALHPGMGCLFMSGYTADVIAHSGVLEAGVHFLEKPFTVQSLTTKIRELLDALPQ